jgi:hypothetical protein
MKTEMGMEERNRRYLSLTILHYTTVLLVCGR